MWIQGDRVWPKGNPNMPKISVCFEYKENLFFLSYGRINGLPKIGNR
ncbi:hypothetical protein LEP1GSC202_1954 [Leptospira yanagawae serovar Saopaulo str. Sao Paulo = ATCC 700523]|uniref:Uncharacterized protein n=1 Tax=Leptospira yanagawae serovar Saopaulo str. Sao Paulo = ATCC 700523 TaxID=1249483 RepID=A0A5E8HGT8_9LEPT|nr:hypothetical protein LEP1GSC202_1954 [Leptospira yanagawae serovar Saopaulo str. Sao Paulo = ATCC 700523]